MKKILTTIILLACFSGLGQVTTFKTKNLHFAAVGGGSTFVNDTFTDTDTTDLTAHTGETGATWAKVTGYTGVIKITSNAAKGDSGGFSVYYASGTPSSAEYDVQGEIYFRTMQDNVGLMGRLSTSEWTGYAAWFDSNNHRFELAKVSAGTFTSLGTWDPETHNVGTNYVVKLEIRDAAKKVYVDGTERISSANNDITDTGKAGLWYGNSDWGFGTTGRETDNFTATNP